MNEYRHMLVLAEAGHNCMAFWEHTPVLERVQ